MRPIAVTDPVATETRRKDLVAYYGRTVLSADRDFICSSASRCRTSASKPGVGFYEGQLPYLGQHYDTAVDGVSQRVLVVPMEVGRDWQRTTMDDFSQAIRTRASQRFADRNNHMRGVTLALRLAFGLGLGDDRAGEFLNTPDGTRIHVLDAFAMVNVVLCSALKLKPTGEPSTTSRQTASMRQSCFQHLRSAVEILQPTLLISQGGGVGNHLARAFTVTRWRTDTVALCRVANHSFTWARLSHPTAWAPNSWSWLSHPYLRDVVEPSIAAARKPYV